MEQLGEILSDVELAMDYAFSGKFVMKFYDYLRVKKVKREEVEQFLHSTTGSSICVMIEDLEGYIEGGQDNLHQQLREGYGHIPKPQARKIKDYLRGIMEDALRYIDDKKPGRRRKRTK